MGVGSGSPSEQAVIIKESMLDRRTNAQTAGWKLDWPAHITGNICTLLTKCDDLPSRSDALAAGQEAMLPSQIQMPA